MENYLSRKQPELRNYEPSLRDNIARYISKGLSLGDEDKFSVDMGHRMTSALEDFGAGALTYGNDAYRDFSGGNYLGAAKNAAIAALSAVPLMGVNRAKALVGRSPYARIDGMPETFRLPSGEIVDADPIPAIVDAAADYAKSRGLPHEVPKSYPEFNTDNATKIAHWYDKAADEVNNPNTQAAYSKLAEETKAQYQALKDRGIEFDFMKRDANGNIIDPYANSPAMGYKDLAEKGRLEIFPTDAGFGTIDPDAYKNAPLLQFSGEYFGDKPATYNDLFRAVHDAYGHFGYGNAFFRAKGEDRAWNLHSLMFSPEARPAMTAETRGQNSWANFGPYGKQNANASGANTVYADQKALSAPDWITNDPRLESSNAGRYIPMPRIIGPTPAPFIVDQD